MILLLVSWIVAAFMANRLYVIVKYRSINIKGAVYSQSDTPMMYWVQMLTILIGLIFVGGVAIIMALGMRSDGIASYYRDTLTAAGFTAWFTGLMVATLSPPIVAITFWFGSKRTLYGWLLHLLLVPVTYAVVRGAIAIMLTAASEPDSDGPTGWATDPAAMLMLLCPAVYFAALGFTRLHRRSVPPNGS